jgi:CheY-like chemotaxis protein
MTDEDIKKLKALLVDDDAFMCELILATLEAIGVSDVKSAGSGQAGLDLLKNHDNGFDLVMCDLYMPDMDGIEFLSHAKEDGFEGNIILFSGVSREMLEQAGRLANAKQIKILGCLEKPIAREDLKNLLSQGELKSAV